MKNTLRFFALAILVLGTMSASAQGMKIGYTLSDYVIGLHPKSKTIQAQLESYKKQLDATLQKKAEVFQQKSAEFSQSGAMMSEVAKAEKQRELQFLYQEIEKYQQDAELDMQKKQVELLKPVLEEIQSAIDAVATENGYDYILNADAGPGTTLILHGPENHNVTELILKKLGIPIPAQK